jgi:HEAT repeat protein
MRLRTCAILFLLLIVTVTGCGRSKSTAELLNDLKGTEDHDRVNAARLLPQKKGDPGQVVPALIQALKDKEGEVRRSAALGLGSFGDKARDAIDTLEAVSQSDRDPRVREAAGIALSRIDPERFPPRAKAPSPSGTTP